MRVKPLGAVNIVISFCYNMRCSHAWPISWLESATLLGWLAECDARDRHATDREAVVRDSLNAAL